MESISSNHFSHDMQVVDVWAWIKDFHHDEYLTLKGHFPEVWATDGSEIDTDAMGVDVEWVSWVTDAIEATGLVMWIDGEPFVNVSDADMAEMEGM